MSRRFFFGLSIMAMAFALILGSGALNTATAVPGENGDAYNLPTGVSNLFGADQAGNGTRVECRFGAPEATVSKSAKHHTLSIEPASLFGEDNGCAPVKVIYKDCDYRTNQFAPDNYGLFGTSQQ